MQTHILDCVSRPEVYSEDPVLLGRALEAIRLGHPILLKAAGVCGLMGRKIWAGRVVDLAELLKAVNSRFPQDSFSVPTLAELMVGEVTYTVEEHVRVAAILPAYPGTTSWKVVAAAGRLKVQAGFTFKKSGVYYDLELAGDNGLTFPFLAELTVYADMDDLDNHGDDCPTRLPEDHPEYSDDCDCTAEVERHEIVPVADEIGFVGLRSWIEKTVEGRLNNERLS